MQTVQHPARF